MSLSFTIPNSDTSDIQKYIEQAQRKKEYNRAYYQAKVKPKRTTEKEELAILRQKCAELESYIASLESNPKDNKIITELKNQTQILNDKISDLTQQNLKYQHDMSALKQALDAARQRNYELMMEKADHLLPSIQNLSLN